jgi:hypothetical protein
VSPKLAPDSSICNVLSAHPLCIFATLSRCPFFSHLMLSAFATSSPPFAGPV